MHNALDTYRPNALDLCVKLAQCVGILYWKA